MANSRRAITKADFTTADLRAMQIEDIVNLRAGTMSTADASLRAKQIGNVLDSVAWEASEAPREAVSL